VPINQKSGVKAMTILRRMFQVILALSLVVVIGCSSATSNTDPVKDVAKNSAQDLAKDSKAIAQAPNSAYPKLPTLNGKATVEMKLSYGTVIMEVDGINAPITAGNFVDLAKRGVYDNLTFHRVIREPSPFVAQGGDPLGNGTGSFIDPATAQPRLIPLEITKAYPSNSKTAPVPQYSQILKSDERAQLRHTRGAVAMARSQNPDSASSQFYIALADINFLDGSYSVFGYVTSGMDVVDKIKLGDRIESMKVIKGIENLKVPA
jgi:peptidyl-prolyl cis-trans isomerase B (cyclophilin B)